MKKSSARMLIMAAFALALGQPIAHGSSAPEPTTPAASATSAVAKPAAASVSAAVTSAPRYPVMVTVTCDLKEYMHGKPGVQYFVAPTGTLKATLVIENTNSHTLHTLSFSSAQRFDFVIRDAQGKEVKRWSEGKMFAQMLGAVALQPGEKLTFTEDVPLGAPTKPLPLGDYTLEGMVTNSSGIAKDIPTPIGTPRTSDTLGTPANVNTRVSARVPFKIIATPAK